MRELVVRTLHREFRLQCPDAETADALAFMTIAPEIPGAVLEPVPVAIHRHQGFLQMEMPRGEPVEGTAAHLLAVLHRLIRDDIVQSEPRAALVHGASVVHPQRPETRILIVGHKEAGKTTLALKLIEAGFIVEGDEHLVVRPTDVIARPRTLRVKSGSLPFVPALEPRIAAMPFVPTWDGNRIYAVPPDIGGASWVIRPGTVAHVVFLEPNHGGWSSLRPIAPGEAFRRILPETLLPDAAVALAAARLRGLVTTAQTWRLSVGDLDGATIHVQRMISVTE